MKGYVQWNPVYGRKNFRLNPKLRLLINSIFGVFYSYFWAGDSCFTKNFFKFTLWDSYFFQKMSLGLLFSKS